MSRCNDLTIAVLLALASLSWSQELERGSCPNPPVQQGFDVQKFTGLWYMVQQYGATPRPAMSIRCSTIRYTAISNEMVQINSSLDTDFLGMKMTFIMTAQISNQTDRAKWTIYNQPATEMGLKWNLNYWVLETDYDTYALIWSCIPGGRLNIQIAAILSRQPTLSDEVRTRINAGLSKYDLSEALFRQVNQTNCTY